MNDFRGILYAQDEDSATECYNAALAAGSAHPNWQQYLENLWERKTEWATCYRLFPEIRGNNTNNVVERSVGIYKDNVLHRSTAYNAVALVNFIVTTMETFYKSKLRAFAYCRNSNAHLMLDQLLSKAKYISDPRDITVSACYAPNSCLLTKLSYLLFIENRQRYIRGS